MEGKIQWWQTRWFVVAMAAIAAIPLLWPTIPPLVDLPGHMGRYRVQLSGEQAPWLLDWYDFKWSLIGNLGFDLLIIPLAPIFGLELAVKLLVISIPVLTVTGLLWIAREVHGRVPATALFALPLAYSFPLHFGFVNFALSMALALNLFGLWLWLARHNRFGLRAVIFVPLSCALWVCHTFGWGFLGVMAFSAEMIRQHDRLPETSNGWGERATHWLGAWIRAGIGCLPLALPIALMVAWRSGADVKGQTGDWFNLRAKISWLTMPIRDRWQAFDIASTAVLYLIIFKGVRDPNIEYSRNLLLSALFLLAVFILLPRIVFGSAYADMRLAPFMIAIAMIGLRPKPGLSIRGTMTVAALGLTFFLVRIAGNTASFYFYSKSYDRELKALDHLPEGARLVSFVGETCHSEWFMSRLQHLPALALERKMAYSNDQWSMAGAQLLVTKYRPAARYSHDPSQLVTYQQCPREWWRPIGRSLARFPREAFDYVWLIIPPPYEKRLEQGLIPVWRDGTSALFKIDHGKPGPELTRDLITPPPPSEMES
ncbi:MAG: hypothetical protein C0500_12980 [Sphingobium sp.]|nr:hypothetical protein [Sphingobium sp.]